MDSQYRQRLSLKNPLQFLALGFGSGLSPWAPGIMGSMAALPLVWLFSQYLSVGEWILAVLLLSVFGVYLCHKTAEAMQVHDHGGIVWDEIAGMLIAFIAVPISLSTLVAGFVLFRILDIFKPWPISWLDRSLHGGWGIMMDDLVAGLGTLAVLHLALAQGWL